MSSAAAEVVDPGGRDAIRGALDAALEAVDPKSMLLRRCGVADAKLTLPDGEQIALSRYRRIRVVGAGKASPGLCAGIIGLLGRVHDGSVATKDGYGMELPGVDVWETGHPVPDVRSMAAAVEARRIARGSGDQDLLLCLLSGGASAAWTAPPAGVALGDVRSLTEGLLRSGMPIEEANIVRKHVSRIAGGRLAAESGAARLVTFAISDVVGASPAAIGSGPTLPDPSRFADAIEVLDRYGVEAPEPVRRHLVEGLAGRVPESPKPGTVIRAEASFHVLASVHDALGGAAGYLRRSGYRTCIVSTQMRGEARSVGREIARYARTAARSGGFRLALLWGGETTVTVRGPGRGGRNQEAALAAALGLIGDESTTLAFLATDGSDGPTDAAGACVDGTTVARGERRGGSASAALADNDSHAFLRAAGDIVVTGPTGTNVNDLAIALIK
jgi:glycerate 2-kinase